MKLPLIFIILFFSLLSFGQKSETIKEFETILGKEHSKALNHLVTNFEKSIRKKYNEKTEEAYRSYFDEMREKGFPVEVWDSEETQEFTDKYLVKNRLCEEIWMKADSMWMDGEVCNCRYSYRDNEVFIRGRLIDKGLEQTCGVIQNRYGIYHVAFDSIAYSNERIAEYIKVKKIAGAISPSMIAGGFNADGSVDFSNYFIKRIVVIDIYLLGFKW